MNRAGGGDAYAIIADLYDSVGPYKDRADIAFYVEAAERSGGPVLEAGCGTGRVLIPTARAGVEVTGLDSSAAVLAQCRAKLEAEPASVRRQITLVEGDMRGFSLRGKFALATFPFRPFQHLITIRDQLSCLAGIREHLIDGARVIVDVFNPSLDALANRPTGQESGEEPEFVMADGRRVKRTHRIVVHDRFKQVNHMELIYHITHAGGRKERIVHSFEMRYFFRYEMEHLLARAGFDIETVNSGYDGSAWGSRYPGELIITARKMS